MPLELVSKSAFENSNILVVTIRLWARGSVSSGEFWCFHLRGLAALEEWLITLFCVEDEGTKIFRIFENYPTTQSHALKVLNLRQQLR
jgi:hypothetical protein